MKTLAVFGISLAAIALSVAPAMAADANGNHEAYKWVVAGDTAVAPDGSTIFPGVRAREAHRRAAAPRL